MAKYIIEGNINFQEELCKLLNEEESDNEDELCQITRLPLKDKYVTLECGHHFNYDAIYKEIYKQKIENRYLLPEYELLKLKNNKKDYFIKCPYCRNIQFTILPYYPELEFKEIYGINSLNKKCNDVENNIYPPGFHTGNTGVFLQPPASMFYKIRGLKGVQNVEFHYNKICDICHSHYCEKIPDAEIYYCYKHYRQYMCIKVFEEKKKLQEEKKKAQGEKKKIQEEKKKEQDEKKKLLDNINEERASKGLTLLKRIPSTKTKIENVVEKNQTIELYVPVPEVIGCKAILQSGENKGKECGCKKLYILDEMNKLCKRHSKYKK